MKQFSLGCPCYATISTWWRSGLVIQKYFKPTLWIAVEIDRANRRRVEIVLRMWSRSWQLLPPHILIVNETMTYRLCSGPDINASTLEKGHTHVQCVTTVLTKGMTLRNIVAFMLDTGRISAQYVEKVSAIPATWRHIASFTAIRDRISVQFVRSNSALNISWKTIFLHIVERSHLLVQCVTRVLPQKVALGNISPFTIRKNK